MGAETAGVVDSGLPGPKGNREFFLHLVHREQPRCPMSSTTGSTRRPLSRSAARRVLTHGRAEAIGPAFARLEEVARE